MVMKPVARRSLQRAYLLEDGKLLDDKTGVIYSSLSSLCKAEGWYGKSYDGWLSLMKDGGQPMSWYRDQCVL